MKLKSLMKSYSFWTALAGALVILINSIGAVFGFQIEEKIISDIVMAVAGVLVAFGIVTLPASTKEKSSSNEVVEQTHEEENQDQNQNIDKL